MLSQLAHRDNTLMQCSHWTHAIVLLLCLFGSQIGQAQFEGPRGPIGLVTQAESLNPAVPGGYPVSLAPPDAFAAQTLPQTSLTAADIEALIDERLAKQKEEEKAKEAALAPTATSKTPDLSMSGKWNKGLEFSTKDKSFKTHIGGRYQLDSTWYDVNQQVQDHINVPYGDGIDFRRARIRIDGVMYTHIEYCIEVDFVNSFRARNQPIAIPTPGFFEGTTPALTDFWWQVRDIPFFNVVRVGQQKEPIGFEHIVSSRFLPFMERSFNQDAFYGGVFNGFNPGISAWRAYGPEGNGTLHYGIYRPVNNPFGYNTGNGNYSVVGRITKLLAYNSDDSCVLHVGVSGKQGSAVSQAGVPGRVMTFRTRDAMRSGLSQDWPVPAGINLYGDDLQQANFELAGIYGRWTMQSEYAISSLQGARSELHKEYHSNAVYNGGYVQLLCFLTDDHDHYDKERAAFDRVTPKQNFWVKKNPCGNSLGGGAWQVGARYDYLDLNDIGLNGGILHNQTYGVNWFLNPNMKIQFNYMNTYRDVSQTTAFRDGSGWIHGFGGRVACDF